MLRKEYPDYPFDKEKFKEVIIKARGERSQAQYAADCALSYTTINKYSNCRLDTTPTIQLLKKMALATKEVSYEELLTAAGYDAEKYKNDRPVGTARKDLLYPVFLGMANSDMDWRIESKGYKDKEPFEIVIERSDVNKWFFVPVTKADITKEEIQDILMKQNSFTSGSKISFVTDDEAIFNRLKTIEFPLLAVGLSVVRVMGTDIIDEVSLKTGISTDISIVNEDKIRPFDIT